MTAKNCTLQPTCPPPSRHSRSTRRRHRCRVRTGSQSPLTGPRRPRLRRLHRPPQDGADRSRYQKDSRRPARPRDVKREVGTFPFRFPFPFKWPFFVFLFFQLPVGIAILPISAYCCIFASPSLYALAPKAAATTPAATSCASKLSYRVSLFFHVLVRCQGAEVPRQL